jgi:hypothetical protein
MHKLHGSALVAVAVALHSLQRRGCLLSAKANIQDALA